MSSHAASYTEFPPLVPKNRSPTPLVPLRPASSISKLPSTESVGSHQKNSLALLNRQIAVTDLLSQEVVRSNSGSSKSDFYQGSFRRRVGSIEPDRSERSKSAMQSFVKKCKFPEALEVELLKSFFYD